MEDFPFKSLTIFSGHFLLGILFCFLIISFFSNRQTKEKTFKFYTGYLVMLILYLCSRYTGLNTSQQEALTNYAPFIRIIQVLAFYYHVQFALSFLDMQTHLPRLVKSNKKVLHIMCGLGIVFLFICFLLQTIKLAEMFYFVGFQLFSLSYVIYLIIRIIRTPARFKHYFLAGVGIYFICIILSGVFSLIHSLSEDVTMFFPPILIFYIGLFLEVFIFSFGLSEKIKVVFINKLKAEQDLLKLKESQNTVLKEEVLKKETELINLFKENEEKEKERIMLRYDAEINKLKVSALQSQMNPHFIFNALNSIKLYIINSDTKNAVYYLNKFSKLIRSILMGSNKEHVTLKEEIDFLLLYVSIENIRFTEGIDLNINISDELLSENIKLPTLLLQPFVENAIWHGLSNKEGVKIITITAKRNDKSLTISVEDNGIGRQMSADIKKSKSIQNESIGLDLTEKRLAYFSKDMETKSTMKIIDLVDEKNNPSGTRVTIEIPVG